MIFDIRENLAAMIMIPSSVRIHIGNGEPEAEITYGEEGRLREYVMQLDMLAFSSPRDYGGFRAFLGEHSDIIGPASEVAECMVDSDLDYILDRVKEERTDSAAYMFGKGLP